MRRTVATLLVVASPLLLAAPVSAEQDRPAPAVAGLPAAPPPAVQGITPTAPAPVTLAVPAVPAPAVAPAVTPPTIPVVGRPTVKRVAKTAIPAGVDDAAYAARLQADLCQARQIFCGLDRSGHYPAG